MNKETGKLSCTEVEPRALGRCPAPQSSVTTWAHLTFSLCFSVSPFCPTRVLDTATSEGPFSSKSPGFSVCSNKREDYFPFHWMNLEGHGFGAQQVALLAKWEKKKIKPPPHETSRAHSSPESLQKERCWPPADFKNSECEKRFSKTLGGIF